MSTENQPTSSDAPEGAQPTTGPTDQSTPLSKNAAKNEAKRRAKMEKFAAKQAALAAQGISKEGWKSTEKKEKKPKSKPATTNAPEPKFVNTTPIGDKKDMSGEMAASYNPQAVEAAWYAWWEKQGYFQPELTADGQVKPKGTFVIPVPPPNVTGTLHIGHALTVSIQDALIRWNRMRGLTTLYHPGMDHAGISTQAVVERMLWKNQGLTRHDLGREAFLEKVWKWKNQYGGSIQNQLRRMGGSFDWSRARFTLDPEMSLAVTEHFVRLYEDGVIYRATRLVNWCVRLNTALSNLEVENKELSGSTFLSVPGYDANEKFQFGVLVCFAYAIEDSDEKLVVATTRVETMLGDTAIAVHPDDPRYKHLHGKYAVHPFVNRRIPIITDAICVDMEFGTGAVKITPAHDFNDYEVGKRHQLEFINILNDDGTFNANAGPTFQGMKRFHARKTVVEALKERGLLVEICDNPMTVPVCAKSGDIIEPVMKPQWYVRCKEMAQPAMEAVTNGDLTILPATSEREWFRWLGNIQDWCISRQLWWGHRIPAYLVKLADDQGNAEDTADMSRWVVARSEAEAQRIAAERFSGQTLSLDQDPDVLDTWFSSALWPFSIQGWPQDNPDLRNFYPASFLETGWDILFFWVARMVMAGIKLTGKVPFKEVFCHAMVRDAHGRKMSKSLGNVIDPIDVIEGITLTDLQAKLTQGNLDEREVKKAAAGQAADFPKGIPECGTDALRFALCAYTATGRDLNLDILRVEGYRKFCNKLWNATRFALLKLGDGFQPRSNHGITGDESLVDRWILHKLVKATQQLNQALTDRNFMAATQTVQNFWLYELCDVYIEAIKPVCDANVTIMNNLSRKTAAQNTLYTCLDWGVRLLHPFMPFITEELFQRLPRRPGYTLESIVTAPFPEFLPEFYDERAEADFDLMFAVARNVRSLMADYNITSQAQAYLTADNDVTRELLASHTATIRTLIKGCQTINVIGADQPLPAGCVPAAVNQDCHVLLLVKGKVDIGAEVERLEKKLAKAQQQLGVWEKKIQIADYETKIRADVREINAIKIKGYQAEIDALTHSLQNFLALKD